MRRKGILVSHSFQNGLNLILVTDKNLIQILLSDFLMGGKVLVQEFERSAIFLNVPDHR